jgi:hypothetical protein
MAGSPGRPRQISVADPLWEIFSTMAEESGNRVDALVNQAMFEMAVKLGYVTPVSRESAPPLEESEKPSPAGARVSRRMTAAQQPAASGQKFAPGRTREAAGRKSQPPQPAKRPPRPAPRPAPAKAEAKGLYIVNEDGDTEKIDKDIYIIGRSSKCDLVINSVKVSREHAIITRERGEFYIEDLGSANGTWYKGEKIEKMKIRDSDEVFICDEKFKFVLR